MAMTRPAKEELDALEQLGNLGWNWESMLPYFKKVCIAQIASAQTRSAPPCSAKASCRTPIQRVSLQNMRSSFPTQSGTETQVRCVRLRKFKSDRKIGPIKKSLPIVLHEIHGLFIDSADAMDIQKNADMVCNITGCCS